ncbi:MAG: tetraacyldisaccharide 4'-kinase [Flavobacteriales bacterium]
MVVWTKNRLFDFNLLSSKEFDEPIICIGNLEAGGTGKSPLVHFTTKTLLKNDLNVAVLSRGYGRTSKGFWLVEVSSIADEVGDEPLQAKLRFPQAIVAVCEDRVEGVKRILESSPKVDVVVMDDGFQHRWIKPSLNILTTPASLPFYQNSLLPVGSLREAKYEAKRADALVFTGGKNEAENNFKGQTFSSNAVAGALIQFAGRKVETDAVKKVVLLSGIANSKRFENSAAVHYQTLHHLNLNDHHRYEKKDLQNLMEIYNSFGAAADAVITTEKDAARLMNSPFLKELKETPVFYLPVDVEFIGSDKKEFQKMILAHGKHARKN